MFQVSLDVYFYIVLVHTPKKCQVKDKNFEVDWRAQKIENYSGTQFRSVDKGPNFLEYILSEMKVDKELRHIPFFTKMIEDWPLLSRVRRGLSAEKFFNDFKDTMWIVDPGSLDEIHKKAVITGKNALEEIELSDYNYYVKNSLNREFYQNESLKMNSVAYANHYIKSLSCPKEWHQAYIRLCQLYIKIACHLNNVIYLQNTRGYYVASKLKGTTCPTNTKLTDSQVDDLLQLPMSGNGASMN